MWSTKTWLETRGMCRWTINIGAVLLFEQFVPHFTTVDVAKKLIPLIFWVTAKAPSGVGRWGLHKLQTLKTRLRSSINHRLLRQYRRYRAQGQVGWWVITDCDIAVDRIRQRLVSPAAGNRVRHNHDEQISLVGLFWRTASLRKAMRRVDERKIGIRLSMRQIITVVWENEGTFGYF